MGSMVHVTKGENFQILAGSASYLLSALAVGASGGVCGLANVLPKEVFKKKKITGVVSDIF